MITEVSLLTKRRDCFDWRNVAESLLLWSYRSSGAFHILEEDNQVSCGEDPQDGPLLWAFLTRGYSASELLTQIGTIWPRILEGGVLGGLNYGHQNWPEVAPTVDKWAAQRGLEVHFTPPHSFWIRQNGGILPRFSIWNQQVLIPAPVEHGFNPSICPHPNDPTKHIFAFRSVEGRWENGRIWIGEVHSLDLQFLSVPHELDLEPPEVNCEDPRLFLFEGEVWLSYTVTSWARGPIVSRVHLVPLEQTPQGCWRSWVKPVEFASPYGLPQEKNWVFFTQAEQLLVNYACSPEWRIHQLFTDAPDEYIEGVVGPAVVWPHGEIRGGTPFIEAPNGNLWSFFHSSCMHDPKGLPEPLSYYNGAFPEELCGMLAPSKAVLDEISVHGRYFCGLLEVCSRTLRPVRIIRHPLLYQTPPGSGRCGHHVIWPAGAIREGDAVILAYGCDDRTSHCCRLSCSLLERLLVSIE